MRALAGFVSGVSTRARGAAAEKAALRWLRRCGFEIVEANYRARRGEIDLIAVDGEYLCFVEIKARASRAYGSPRDAVPLTKQRRIAKAAGAYLAESGWEGPCRFDVLGIEKNDGGWSFDLVRNAFWVEAEARRRR